jgi:hypothetical protein
MFGTSANRVDIPACYLDDILPDFFVVIPYSLDGKTATLSSLAISSNSGEVASALT